MRPVPRCSCATEETKAELDKGWQAREDARKKLRYAPNDRSLLIRRFLKMPSKQRTRTRAEAVRRFFEEYVSQLEGIIRESDHCGFYKHIQEMDVKGKRTFNSHCIKDEEGRLLRDNAFIRELWAR